MLMTRLNTKSSIQKKIFSYFLLFSLFLSLCFLFLTYGIFFKSYIDSEKDNALRSANKTKQNIEFLLNMTENTASLLATAQPLLDALATNESVLDQHYSLQKTEQDIMLKSIITVHEFIDNIYILGTDGEFFSSYWDSDQLEIETRFYDFIRMQKTRSEYINGEPIINYFPFFDLNIISFTRPIFLYPDNEGLGLIVIEMNYTYLREMFTHSSLQNDDEKILVMNKAGETLFTFPFNTSLDPIIKDYPELLEGNKEIQGKVFGNDSFIVSSNISHSDWIMVRILSKEKIYATINNLIKIGIILWFLVIIFSFLISYAISVSITNPIIKLHETILEIDKGNLKIRAKGEGPDEIGQLALSFNHMVERISNLMTRTLKEQKMKSDLEFQILESQINPHFLYNTLDSIKWLAVFQNVENISDMVSSLISLLQFNMSNKSKLVPLVDEIECIKNYVEIQKFRFGDAFEVVYDIEESVSEMYILKFILQPLVENAIFHAFDNIDYRGIINISARVCKGILEISVRDNGKGMQETDVIQDEKSSFDRKKMHNSIGIKNVSDRLMLYFGDKASFSISNDQKQGVLVVIALPLLDGNNTDFRDSEDIMKSF